MTREHWLRIKEITAEALDLEPGERAVYITEACGQDPDVLSEVLRLVTEADASGQQFLESPSWSPRAFLTRKFEIDERPVQIPQRFEILREAGRGGMGVVFECLDRERNLRVALKTLARVSPLRLYSFKQEFRGLAGITHPNLVCLYEFLQEERRYFLSMEFVEGVGFLEYAGGRHFGRLRAVLPQIVDGLFTIHAAGKLHRDLKPSNVMITASGRAVILDFGLVAEQRRELFGVQRGGPIGGTLSYMAPEQLLGVPAPASDWYSLGVMLFEALTGKLPSPDAPLDLDPSLPADLVEICQGLLAPEPTARIGAAQILDLLGVPKVVTSFPENPSARLVGRDRELGALVGAFQNLSRSGATVALLHGSSGTGKTTLAEHFLRTVSSAGEVLVLTGRCYEQEAVPYKAVDGLIDQLSQLFMTLPPEEMEAILPQDASSLAAVFPVLECIPAFRQAGLERPAATDQIELRRCAFFGMRDMLARIGERTRLVVWLDDLQWMDLESAQLLSEAMRSPEAPRLLLFCSYRSDAEGANPGLIFLVDALERDTAPKIRIELEPLNQEDSAALAANLLGETRLDSERALAIARYSGGLPFFIRELVQRARTDRPAENTLESMIWSRVNQLEEESQHILYLLAVAGRPIEQRDLFRAAGLGTRDPSVLNRLAGMGLVRSAGSRESDLVEAFHDRIRETISGRLTSGEASRMHRDLANALELGAHSDPETLATHLEAAGEQARAGVYFLQAADRAARAVAFERAVLLYEKALLHSILATEERKDVEFKLAEVLAYAGRSGEASRHYFQAAEYSSADRGRSLESIGAYHLCAAGRIDEGRDRFARLLKRAGRRPPERSPRMIAAMYWRAVRLKVPRRIEPAAEASARDLSMIDLLWFAGVGIGTSDLVCGFALLQDSLLLALKVGEPTRLIRALAFYIAFAALTGQGRSKRAERRLTACRELAERIGSPPAARAALMLTSAIGSYNLGHWSQALTDYAKSEQILVEECRGLNWELSFARTGKLWTLVSAGAPAVLGREASSALEDALSRGDRATATNAGALPLPYSIILLSDQPEAARTMIKQWLDEWACGFGLQHACGFLAQAWAWLYEGNLTKASRLLEQEWELVKRSGILRLATSAALFWETRARVLAGAAQSAKGYRRQRMLWELSRTARRLRRVDAVHAPAFVAHIDALLCGLEENRAGAVAHMRRAVQIFERCEMTIHALAFRRRLGEWVGGEEGARSIAEADRLMRALEIANPEAVARMHTVEIERLRTRPVL